MLMVAPAYAQSATTLGDAMQKFGNEFFGPIFLTMVASGVFLVGGYFFINGIITLAKAFANRGGGGPTPANALARIMCGIFMLSVGRLTGVGLATALGSTDEYAINGIVDEGAVVLCSGANMLTCVSKNFANNIVPVGVDLIFSAFFILGLFWIASTLIKMAQNYGTGQNSQEKGLLIQLLIGIIVLNLPAVVGILSNTFGISDNIFVGTNGYKEGSSLLSYLPPGSGGILGDYAEMIGHIFKIMVFFGLLFIGKGFISLKKAAAGNSRDDDYGKAYIMIFGGIGLVYMKFVICLILSTFIGIGNNYGFC